jgi:hypothetical protein
VKGLDLEMSVGSRDGVEGPIEQAVIPFSAEDYSWNTISVDYVVPNIRNGSCHYDSFAILYFASVIYLACTRLPPRFFIPSDAKTGINGRVNGVVTLQMAAPHRERDILPGFY